jgi:hypothetical protein
MFDGTLQQNPQAGQGTQQHIATGTPHERAIAAVRKAFLSAGQVLAVLHPEQKQVLEAEDKDLTDHLETVRLAVPPDISNRIIHGHMVHIRRMTESRGQSLASARDSMAQ